MSEWPTHTLSELIQLETGKREKGGGKSSGEILSLGGEHITDSGQLLTEKKQKYISRAFYENLKQGRIHDGDILMVKDGATTGKTAWIEECDQPLAVNEHVFILRTDAPDRLCNGFLFFFLKSDSGQGQIRKRFHGLIGGVTRPDVFGLKLQLPPPPEQKKIAHILSTIQRAIEAQERIIQTTTELKKALMHKLFTEGLRNEPQKQTEIGPIPESWEVVPLAKIIRSKLQNGAFVKKPETGRGYLFANVVNMYRETHLDLSQLERIDVPINDVNQYWLEEGDILVVRSSLKREGIGQNCVARNLVEPVFYDCHLIRVQIESSKLVPEFLSNFWRSDIGKNDLVLRSKTTTMTTINQQGISKSIVPIAPIDEQEEIVNSLETVDKKIRFSRKHKDVLQSIFRTLLHELMTAKTRVHNLIA